MGVPQLHDVFHRALLLIDKHQQGQTGHEILKHVAMARWPHNSKKVAVLFDINFAVFISPVVKPLTLIKATLFSIYSTKGDQIFTLGL